MSEYLTSLGYSVPLLGHFFKSCWAQQIEFAGRAVSHGHFGRGLGGAWDNRGLFWTVVNVACSCRKHILTLVSCGSICTYHSIKRNPSFKTRQAFRKKKKKREKKGEWGGGGGGGASIGVILKGEGTV